MSLVRLRPVWMTNHPPSVLWYCWLGHQTCKNRRPYNLYCVGADVKHCSIQSTVLCVLLLQDGMLAFKMYQLFLISKTEIHVTFLIKEWCLIGEQKHLNFTPLRYEIYGAAHCTSFSQQLFTTGIEGTTNSLLHYVNLIVFTLLLAHFILRISPHHSHHLRSHHLSLQT